MSIIQINSVVIHLKEKRKCSVCKEVGHNKRKCPKVDKIAVNDETSSVESNTEEEETITPWEPFMFKIGVTKMPTLIGWKAGINSLEYYEDMKKNPFYKYDDKVKAFRRI